MKAANRRFGQALCWTACALLIIGPQRAHAAPKKPHITGMFSNLSLGYEYSGEEMWVVPSSDGGYAVVFQCSPDAPETPVVVKPTVKQNEISFVIPPSEKEECDGSYKGTVTESGFDGTYSGKDAFGKAEEYAIHLKRRQTHWQTH